MRKIRFFNIEWDTDGRKVSKLPREVELEVDSEFDPELEGADLLSDKFGYCVFGFDF